MGSLPQGGKKGARAYTAGGERGPAESLHARRHIIHRAEEPAEELLGHIDPVLQVRLRKIDSDPAHSPSGGVFDGESGHHCAHFIGADSRDLPGPCDARAGPPGETLKSRDLGSSWRLILGNSGIQEKSKRNHATG